MLIVFASLALLSTILLWFREIRPMFYLSDGCIKKVWNDTSMHGHSWAKIHVWPHVVGGIVWMGVLYLPWVQSPHSLLGKFAVVFVIQWIWELAQVVTWSPNPTIQKFAILWAPMTSFLSFPHALIHIALGMFWMYWFPIVFAITVLLVAENIFNAPRRPDPFIHNNVSHPKLQQKAVRCAKKP